MKYLSLSLITRENVAYQVLNSQGEFRYINLSYRVQFTIIHAVCICLPVCPCKMHLPDAWTNRPKFFRGCSHA